jgi:RNA polymerase sigma-70 factor (ECF subfamily)
MASGDTTLGGGDRSFPETTMGFAAGLRAGDVRALEVLARRYWKPVYSYVRIAWSKSNEDAKDAAQAFFAWLLEEEALRAYDPARGGFRAYLKVLLRRFVGHAERDASRLKRGGAAAFVPLAEGVPELRSDEDPEKAFERVWFEELVAAAVARVRAARPDRFRVYESHALAGEPPSYADVAARLGIGVGEVEKSLHLVREEIRREIRAALAEESGGGGEVEDDWKRLLGG